MSKFDTHGGYFAPKDYMKVEAGGSHEENPNGGVQIGVDQEGTPNLLEEGEPVYKDYVYSDNIKASERFLKDNNIPEKYAGDLYSKIADSLFSEAENRPNDPISRNGLEAMLGRLADAQESQKAYNEQRKLERELKKLSPDELAALEQMLAAGEQQEMQEAGIQPAMMPEQQVAPEQMALEQPMAPEQMPVEKPMMGCGGHIGKRYATGGNTDEPEKVYPDFTEYYLSVDPYTNPYPYIFGNAGTDVPGASHGGGVRGKEPKFGLLSSRTFDPDRTVVPTQTGAIFHLPVAGDIVTSERKHGAWPIDGDYMWKGPVPKEETSVLPVVSGELVDYQQPPKNKVVKAAVKEDPLQAIVDATNERIANEEIPSVELPYIANSTRYERMSPIADRVLSKVDLSDTGAQEEPITPDINDEIDDTPEESRRVKYGNPYLSTFPRYAGAIGSGILGLYNALQKPDKYTATRYKPFVPTGRIALQNQVYNPVDQNMLMNHALAQGNSVMRGLRNSGLGPSTQAAMIAQDNNISGNIGNTFLQAWDANNQRRNAVIAANNQNEAQRAQFDYTVDAARQRALAEAQYRNAQNDLMIQRLNNQAEADKYAAISNQISNALQALSGIGQENFVMNQVNSNPANEGYGIFNNGNVAYLPYYYRRNYKCGGKIKK